MFWGGSFKVLKIKGITISIDLSWLIIFGLFVFLLAQTYFPNPQVAPGHTIGTYWLFATITTLLFFASVVVHELSHALVARRRGIPISQITLFIFGGVAQMEDEPRTPGDEFTMAIAGPLASIGVAILFYGITQLALPIGSRILIAMFVYLAFINAVLAVFNLLPGFPMDGGRVFRSLLWKVMGDMRRATLVASLTGQVFGWGLIVLGIGSLFLPALRGYGSIWFALIGWFLISAARSSYQQVVLRETLQRVPIREVMSPDVQAVPPDITLERLVAEYFLRESPSTLPVERDGALAGVISVEDVRAIPRERWPAMLVVEVMKPLEEEQVLSINNDAWDATNRMAQSRSDRVLVAENRHVEGIVTRGSIMRWLQTHTRLAPGEA